MKASGPEACLWWQFYFIGSISFVTSLFCLSVSSWLRFGQLFISRKLFISFWVIPFIWCLAVHNSPLWFKKYCELSSVIFPLSWWIFAFKTFLSWSSFRIQHFNIAYRHFCLLRQCLPRNFSFAVCMAVPAFLVDINPTNRLSTYLFPAGLCFKMYHGFLIDNVVLDIDLCLFRT